MPKISVEEARKSIGGNRFCGHVHVSHISAINISELSEKDRQRLLAEAMDSWLRKFKFLDQLSPEKKNQE
jgi:hypothetical protein